ncbi:MAG: lipoprotein [Methylotenera sp.]|nr:lipoprotein [Methylotenera sp.]
MLLLLVSYILTACGTKGPLYIPEHQYPQPTPANK